MACKTWPCTSARPAGLGALARCPGNQLQSAPTRADATPLHHVRSAKVDALSTGSARGGEDTEAVTTSQQARQVAQSCAGRRRATNHNLNTQLAVAAAAAHRGHVLHAAGALRTAQGVAQRHGVAGLLPERPQHRAAGCTGAQYRCRLGEQRMPAAAPQQGKCGGPGLLGASCLAAECRMVVEQRCKSHARQTDRCCALYYCCKPRLRKSTHGRAPTGPEVGFSPGA